VRSSKAVAAFPRRRGPAGAGHAPFNRLRSRARTMFLSHAHRSTTPCLHARATKTSLNAPPLRLELWILNPRRRRLTSLPAPASCVLAPRTAPGLLTHSVHTSTTSSLACPPPAHKHTSPPATQRPSSASSRLDRRLASLLPLLRHHLADLSSPSSFLSRNPSPSHPLCRLYICTTARSQSRSLHASSSGTLVRPLPSFYTTLMTSSMSPRQSTSTSHVGLPAPPLFRCFRRTPLTPSARTSPPPHLSSLFQPQHSRHPRQRRARRCCPPPCAHAHASRRRSTRHLRRLRQRAARPPSDTPRRRCTTEASQPAQSKPASEPREQRSGRLRRGMRTARPLGARRLRDAAPGASRLRMKCARRSPAEICTLRPVPSDCIAAPRRPGCPDAGGARSQALAARREQLRACRCTRPATAARWARRAAPCRRPRRCPPRPRSRRAGQQQQAGKLRQAHARRRAALPVTTRGLAASRCMHSAGAATHAEWPRAGPPAALRR
jgi:hypothetical protein